MSDKDLDLLIEMGVNSLKSEYSGKDSYDLFYSETHETSMPPWSDKPLNNLQLAALGIKVHLYGKGLTQL